MIVRLGQYRTTYDRQEHKKQPAVLSCENPGSEGFAGGSLFEHPKPGTHRNFVPDNELGRGPRLRLLDDRSRIQVL